MPRSTSTTPGRSSTRAQRRPLESARQVLVVPDVHLALKAAPALLKTVEEPPPSTVFVLLADDLPPGPGHHRQPVRPGPVRRRGRRRRWRRGWSAAGCRRRPWPRSVAAASGGNLDRARLLAERPGVRRPPEPVALGAGPPRRHRCGGRRRWPTSCWRWPTGRWPRCASSTPGSWRPWRSRPRPPGREGVPGRKEVEDRHKREERRWRTDDLRMGLAALAEAYRDRLVATVGRVGAGRARRGRGRAPAGRRATWRRSTGRRRALGRNVREDLLLEALMVELSGMAD